MARSGRRRFETPGAGEHRATNLPAPRLSIVGHADHLRRGRFQSIFAPAHATADHKDSLRVERRGRAKKANVLQLRARLELHSLEVQYLCN